MRSLISLVMCGITCTVSPRYVAAPLLGEHRLVDRAGGRVRLAGERHVDEALVVAEVEVGLAAVVGDEHLAVLEGVHRARVDVDVGVELLHRDPQAPGLEQPPERGGGEPLAEARRHSTGHEDVLRQDLALSPVRRPRKRPLATVPCGPPTNLAHRRTVPPNDGRVATPSAPGRSPRTRRHWRTDALVLGLVAVVLRTPGALRRPVRSCSTTACSGRRRWRCATASCRSATSSRARDRCSCRSSGSPTSSGSARSTRRGCSPSRRACCSRSRSTRAPRRVTTRGHALLAAGLVTTSGSVLWVTGAGERRRPVAGALGARGRASRSRCSITRPAPPDAVWVGLAAGGAVSIKALSVPAVVIAGCRAPVSGRSAECGTLRSRRRSRSACTW